MSTNSSIADVPFYNITGIGINQDISTDSQGSCPWCSKNGTIVWHQGPCPLIKEIEYHPNGTLKRVLFR